MLDRKLLTIEEEVAEAPESASVSDTEAAEGMKDYKPEGKESSYLELEQKLTAQGQELGEYRKFTEEVAPLLKVLQEDKDLFGQVVGRLGGNAETQEEPAQAMPAPTSADDVMQTVEQRIRSFEEQQTFERKVEKFIETHPDFRSKLPKIMEVIDRHEIHDDIELAYKIANYEDMERKLSLQNGAKDTAVENATSVGGGASPATGDLPAKDDFWDLLAPPQNPNSIFSNRKKS